MQRILIFPHSLFVCIFILNPLTAVALKEQQEAKKKEDMKEYSVIEKPSIDEIISNNKPKFAAIKALNLPIGQYAITGSGALGIRNLRVIGDIDIIVTSELWNVLEKKYGVTDEHGLKKIIFPEGLIEALGEHSYYSYKNAPTISERIANAEIIEGLPFESLEHVLYYKRMFDREKDKHDIEIIEAFTCEKQKRNKSNS